MTEQLEQWDHFPNCECLETTEIMGGWMRKYFTTDPRCTKKTEEDDFDRAMGVIQ